VFSTTDTIVAIATPPGRGGIGVVRLSGPSAHSIARQLIARTAALHPRHATLATIRPSGPSGGHSDPFDNVVVIYFPSPASYTGDDVVEISAHGSPVVLKAIVVAACAAGARLAEPGEFTLRAYLNGRLDLLQAEAVADLIDAVTPLQARAAFDQLNGTLTGTITGIDSALFDLIAQLEASVDFPEEGYHFVDPTALAGSIDRILQRTGKLLANGGRGRLVREGLQVAIVGAPNVGKSSLFNALAGANRAIVTAVPGTTRDLVTETVDFDGVCVTLVDTAGLRDTEDAIETEGIARAHSAAAVAEVILLVIDRSVPRRAEAIDPIAGSRGRLIRVAAKSDLPAAWSWGETDDPCIEVSSTTGAGLAALRERILQAMDAEPLRDRPEITNVRHIALVERADVALRRARNAAMGEGGSMPEEFVLADLQDARAALEEITGKRASDDLLSHIFANFCIGK
jgi:tRNA modification GTPase